MSTVSDGVAIWLAEKEITYAFGIIGGGNVSLWDAIARHKKTQLVCCHHEQAAVMAATYYGRQCGRIAIALVTTGAGSTNAITGVMAAFMDSAPVIVISGNESAEALKSGTRVRGTQGYDSAMLAVGFTKYAARLPSNSWRNVLDFAYHEATRPRMGPCWIDCPKDVQNAAL